MISVKSISLFLFLAAAGLGLAGCNENQVIEYQTQYRAIVPPDVLYQCPGKPAKPTAPVTDKKVAEFIVKLDNAHSVCSKSLDAIRAFAEQAKLTVETNNPK